MTDPFAGQALFEDIEKYASFGVHRYASEGERAAMSWLAAELGGLGFDVTSQALLMHKQYMLEHAAVSVGMQTLEAFPHWWIPEDRASFSWNGFLSSGSGPLPASASSSGSSDRAIWVALPHERGAYLDDRHRHAISQAATQNPGLIILTIDNPAGEIFTYNVSQDDAGWPVPVVMVAASHKPLLEEAVARALPLSVSVRGRYLKDVPGRNVIGRHVNGRAQRASGRQIVVSTPVSSWFVSACERGPGIASFLALARLVAKSQFDADFTFVATAGHEIGHGGMEAFLATEAPPVDVTTWIHLGASHASLQWTRDEGTSDERTRDERTRDERSWKTDGTVNAAARMLVMSPSMQHIAMDSFRDVPMTHFLADKVGVGELREVKAAGYANFLGVAGSHHFFHTPRDGPEMLRPALLEPVARAFARALQKILGLA